MKRLPTFFLIIAIIAVGIGFAQLRVHQQQVESRTKSIVEADKAGSATGEKEKALRAYGGQHMLTSTTYVLEGSYQRATHDAQAAANPGGNSEVYAQAQTACGGQSDSVSQARCVQNYLATHATPAANPTKVTMPNKSDKAYTKNVVSPGWTPDSAGLAFLTAATAALLSLYTALLRRN